MRFPASIGRCGLKPAKPGEYHLFCAEYCGTNHSRMIGRIVVMEDIEYQKWLGGYTEQTPAEEGKRALCAIRLRELSRNRPRQRCPTLGEICMASRSKLDNGQKVLVDEAYIRESILDPEGEDRSRLSSR